MQRDIDQIRFKALYEIGKMIDRSKQEILDYALEASLKITNSEIGYIFLVSNDENELYLHAWSKKVMDECEVKDFPNVYKKCETGLWGEALRQRKPIITNQYEKSPYKKGFPEGHITVKNHMNLPVSDKNQIVIIAGVGNKKDDYVEDDVRHLTLLMDATWNLIKRKESEEELKSTNENLEKIIEERTTELEKANEELYEIINKQQIIELELKRNENLFKGVFNNASVGMILFSKEGKVTLANETSSKILGYPENELVNMNIGDLLHPDEKEDSLQIMKESPLEGKNQWSSSRKIIRKDGETIWFNLNTSVLKNPDGSVESYIVVGIDNTSEIKAKKAINRHAKDLSRSRNQLKLIIDNIPAFLFYVDNNLKYTFVNRRCSEIFELPSEYFKGKHISKMIGYISYERYKDYYKNALKGEEQKFEQEITILGKDYILDVAIIPHHFEDGVEGLIILSTDITERKKVENKLKTYSDRLELATLAGNIGVWEWDPITNELIWDKRMFELYGVSEKEFNQNHSFWRQCIHKDDLEETEEALRRASGPGGRFNHEFRIVWPDKQIRNIKAAAFTQFNDHKKAIKMTGVNWDITKQKEMEKNLRKLSVTDPLTGAYNRRYFMEQAYQELLRCERYGFPLSLLTLDIDRFKTINDKYGHAGGDEVLISFVKKGYSIIRSNDIFSRIGGEEFALLLVNTGIYDASKIAERFREEIEELVVYYHDMKIKLTTSIGLTTLQKGDSLETLLKRSDKALYNAKESGRNRVEKELADN